MHASESLAFLAIAFEESSMLLVDAENFQYSIEKLTRPISIPANITALPIQSQGISAGTGIGTPSKLSAQHMTHDGDLPTRFITSLDIVARGCT